MARSDFIQGLETLGFVVTDLGEGRISFEYLVEVGSHAGKTIHVGLETGDDFPLNPPAGGIHVSPRLLDIHPGGDPPFGGVNESPGFGSDWQYWSRPFPEWASTDRTVRQYMSFVRQLFSLV
jgi:hypothetical protein